jgi:hypothetical protein
MPVDHRNKPDGRRLLAMTVGHEADWSAAALEIEARTDAELDAFAEQAATILGKRQTLPTRSVRDVLRTALAEVRTAWSRAQLPNVEDDRERHIIGEADVLTEPHPPGRPTILYCSIELLHRGNLLHLIGLRRYVEIVRKRPRSSRVGFNLDGQSIGWATDMREGRGWTATAYVDHPMQEAHVGVFETPELAAEAVGRIGFTPSYLRRGKGVV